MKKCLISVFILLIACSKEAPIDDEPVRVPTYTLTVNSGEGGTVDSTGGTYNQGQTVSVRAIPNPGYEFTGWLGDASGTSNPLSITIDSNTSITAQFTRIKYLLGVNISGDGNVTQEVISAGKTPTEYNSGTVVRLESIPSDGWLFHTWSGSSTDTGNIIDITIDGTKTVTASFEEIIAIVLDPDGISARGVGKWKIKKRTSLSGASKDVSSQEKSLNDPCEIYEVIFRSDGTFTMVSAVGTNSGNYVYIDDSTIYLTKQGQEYARYENVVLTESVMSFTLILGDCDYSYKTEKDETYDEATDPITGTISDTIECTITGGLSSGSISQTVTATFEIDTVAFEFSTTCTEAFTITAVGLPPGITVTDIFDECCVNVQGTTTEAASGTYVYSITASNSFTSYTVTGSIEVVQEASESCTSAALSVIDGQLNQTITIGDAITQTRLQLDTDCPDDDNNVPLNSISSGLPSGVGYSFDGENNQVIISGTPEFTGVFNYSITYYNNDTIDSSTVTTSIGGTFTVSSTQATTTSEEDCTINASLVSGSYNQTASPGETINLVVRITSDCATITNSSMVYNPGDSSGVNPGADGLPPGLTFNSTEYQNGVLTVTVNGTLSNQASGTYPWGLVYDNSYSLPPTPQDASPIQAATTSITIQSVFTVVASSTSSSSTNNSGNIYFENGTCKCPNASVSDTSTLDGLVYTVVDNSTIQGEVDNGNVNLCTTLVTNMTDVFKDKSSFNSNINFWDVSNVTNMTDMFNGASLFNQDLSNWDVSGVTSFNYMFFGASAFNGNIVNWNTSAAQYIHNMFNGATVFNQNIGGWDTSSVIGMAGVFDSAENFNQDISNWNTSSVNNMESMFFGATVFNQDISGWDVSNVTDMSNMFRLAEAFNQNVGGWNTANVTNMANLFYQAYAFDQDLSNWNTSNVNSMRGMFTSTNCSPNIGGWNVSNVTNMDEMFNNANVFNDDISGWDTSNVTNMESMFRDAGVFNQDIGNWDVSNVTNMTRMFRGAPNFNQDLTRWCVTNITSEPEQFTNEASALVNSNKPVWGTCPSDCIITYSQNITSFTTTETTQGFSPSTILFTLNEICTQNDPHLEYVAGLPSGLSVELNYFPATATTPSNWSGVITGTAEIGTQGSYNIELAVSNAVPADGVNIGDPGTTSSTISFDLIVYELQSNTDTTPPVITLNGSSTIQLNVGDSWSDPGATATDETDGDLTNSITVSGTVDTSTVGTYTLIYSVADAASNSASTTRVVIVDPGATSSIYFENGTCKCPNASVSDTATIDGIVYTVVDNSTIQGEVDNGNVNLCTTKVTSMYRLFLQKTTFNSDIGFWDTSNVTNMEALFQGAWVFNQDISNWDTSSVTNMHLMFYVARAFNQNIGAWNVSNVTDMSNMFDDANTFNQDIGSWNTSSVTNMAAMFKSTPFNQDIGSWNVSNVEDMTGIFTYATSFNQDIGDWNLSNATTINGMFLGASSFNQDIGGWNTSSVTGDGFINVFVEATSFNQDIGDWDVSNGSNFQNMFLAASSFNQDLSGWCVSNVQTESTDFATDSALIDANKPIWGTCPDYNINVTASSNSDYTLSGSDRNGTVTGNDPSITINVGDEINFIVDAASHPFYIKTVQGTGTDNLASNVTNNGATSGVVNWTPTTAGTYYYQCSVHNGMYGTITVQ